MIPSSKKNKLSLSHGGFTLVELLVVIGIIALLIAMLLPSLNKARASAKKLQCAANLKDIGNAIMIYANDSRGWLVPVGGWEIDDDMVTPHPGLGRYLSLGTNVAPPFRWPMAIYKLASAPAWPSNLQAQYIAAGKPYDPVQFPVEPYTPKVMRCPADTDDMLEAHSYIINKHLAKTPDPGYVKKYGSKMGRGLSPSQVPLVGEKPSQVRDYYMEVEHYTDPSALSEFDRVVELYRHGSVYGSNYLFMDFHVASSLPAEAFGALDPWDIPAPTPTGNGTP